MKLFYSDSFVLPLPEGHRFPIAKYALLRERAAAEGLGDLILPEAADDRTLLRAHTADYLHRIKTGAISDREMRQIGFPWSPHLIERSRRSVGATIAACRAALSGDGFAANLAGGTHHAFADHGEGYCVFNDSVIAARAMQAEGRVRRVVIIDCDVHQGNGIAAILTGDDTIFSFSIHGSRNYPFRKERSDLDIALEDGTGDTGYLAALETGLRQAVERSRADLAIYLAGADPYEHDRLGRLSLTKAGLLERDRMVFEVCRNAGIPVAITMAGGYARAIADTVDIHAATLRLAASMSG
ncbi:histone deacetylase family protein [Roseiflexus castenholzii]|jgi:acetoin utilization deacetylase AcuC-like enzyme|uniref:Histone deacetylase superfamily n=1 Tax=Roseiflexus castenholzii (strain DSM 13941 / HLO8) TaxID=383372 RepID=A7NPK2_ROSCS|nr:histone deacetylase [Roseiflexus castenholzii]ABU59498.1 histone deacetylase superfamily [Roseiflexus castenholzii DSM 13941]